MKSTLETQELEKNSFAQMDESYHYPPDLLNLLIDTIPLLSRSKNDVLVFFRGAGVTESMFSDLSTRVRTDRTNVNKFEITRSILQRVNEQGDSALRCRREIIKRVVEFEDFSTCWASDQLKAKGLVSEIRHVVNVKDSFTRISQERAREREAKVAAAREKTAKVLERNERLEAIKKDLYGLFAMISEPQKRGKHLEKVLNELFRAHDILVKEDFRRRSPDGPHIIEQIDGVVVLDGNIYFVEMKWVSEPVGVALVAPHLVRLFGRAEARGIFISSDGYTDTAIAQCKEALTQKVIILSTLQEIVFCLDRGDDFSDFLRKKISEVVLTKNPFASVS
jgi:hypothetical protein